MRAFLGVSCAPDAAERLRRPQAPALACLADDDVVVDRVAESVDGWVAFAGTERSDIVDDDPAGSFTVALSRVLRTREAEVRTADLPAMLSGRTGLRDMLPPFAAANRAGAGSAVLAATDWLGFRQLYWWQGDGVAAVSTSARALSVLAGRGLDPVGLGMQAMIGWQVGDTTVFDSIRAIPPATIATLRHGRVTLRRYAEPFAQPSRGPALQDAVEEMAEILHAWLGGYVERHPDAVLQLTGGHDSRILLGAVPEKLRGGLRALTLGDPGSPDVAIAARLSERYGMRHLVHRLDEQRWPTPAEAHALALAASRAIECLASPLALAPLLLAESHLEQGHRLSGLGGEVARGFYYAGQPKAARTSPRLVERLARWRLFSNEAVEPAALDPEFQARARRGTVATLGGLFAPGDWLRATDGFYLYHRMHRWAGVHGTVAAVRRESVNPMFDRRFIELALAVDPADKRDSLLLGRLMTRLDPELARIPLDSGLVPARLGNRSTGTRLAVAATTARKGVRKVRQRIAGGRRPQLGAAHAAALVVAHWRADPAACGALYDVPAVRPGWLDGLLAGRHDAEPTTVAFLVNVLAATERPR